MRCAAGGRAVARWRSRYAYRGGKGAFCAPPAPSGTAYAGLRARGSVGWARGARPPCTFWRWVAAPCGGVAGVRAGSNVRLRRDYFKVGFADRSPGSGFARLAPASPLPELLLSLTYSAIA